MKFGGEHTVPARRERVWEALNDPAVLEACIPGVRELEKRSGHEFAATVQARIGPVRASFRGAVTLSELDPPNSYRISGEGAGGAAGFVRGGARVRLEDAPAGATRLAWEAEAQVGGKLAQVGSRLVGGAAKRLAGEFFDAFSEHVGAGAPDAPATTGTRPAANAPRRNPYALWGLAAVATAILAAAFALALGWR